MYHIFYLSFTNVFIFGDKLITLCINVAITYVVSLYLIALIHFY